MKKIMIVDDEQISLMMTDNILRSQYHTVCATSGEDAIKLFAKEKPDMVLSDLHMPGITGFELQEKLQQQAGAEIPFMFMTADNNDETESQGFANGALDFIRKPFRADVLLRRITNILQNVEQIQGLRRAAVTDPMTGLLNKTSSEEEIGILCGAKQGVLMMIDLDSFKLVNDLYGHEMGDRILIRFAEIIRSAVRSTDLIGRLGGDEFIAYCQNVKNESIIASKTAYINDELVSSAKEFMGSDMSIPLGASIGCAVAPDQGQNFETLYKKADEALYKVKDAGKHGYAFFNDRKNEERSTRKKTSNLSSAMTILGERNKSAGAFLLPKEKFSSIYQFLCRVNSLYEKEVWMLLFTINPLSDDADLSSAAEHMTNVLQSSLRSSDVVTKHSENQFLVILFETELYNIEIIVERIMNNWKNANIGDQFELTYELDNIKSQ